MDPQKILNLYAARLEIEEVFKDAKTNAGFGKYRGNNHHAHQRFSQLILVAQSLNQLIALKGKLPQVELNEPWRKKNNSQQLSQNQLRRVLRAHHIG